jgi:K+-transporting ATPase ATPase C chain
MRRQLLPALRMLLLLTVLTGIVYPLAVTAIAQVGFHDAANGSVVEAGGEVVGSRWIGQDFTEAGYFHPRPSAVGYDPTLSGGSNLGPTNPDLLAAIGERAAAYREENHLDPAVLVPIDAVTASSSGLDPHISVANARIQASRVAAARGLPLDVVLRLVDDNTDGRSLGFLGEPGVNVLMLNLALDGAGSR